MYRFAQRARDDDSPASWGVSHGSEVPFVFDHGDWNGAPNASFTPAEERLATSIGRIWARFARGQPPASEATWARYDLVAEKQAVLDTREFRLERTPRAHACDVWEELGWF